MTIMTKFFKTIERNENPPPPPPPKKKKKIKNNDCLILFLSSSPLTEINLRMTKWGLGIGRNSY